MHTSSICSAEALNPQKSGAVTACEAQRSKARAPSPPTSTTGARRIESRAWGCWLAGGGSVDSKPHVESSLPCEFPKTGAASRLSVQSRAQIGPVCLGSLPTLSSRFAPFANRPALQSSVISLQGGLRSGWFWYQAASIRQNLLNLKASSTASHSTMRTSDSSSCAAVGIALKSGSTIQTVDEPPAGCFLASFVIQTVPRPFLLIGLQG